MKVEPARIHGRLLWRILQKYAVVSEMVQVGPVRVEFTRVADPNRVLDEVAMEEDRRERVTGLRKREDELHLPYWAELWESSVGLGWFLAEQWAHCGGGQSAVAGLARRRLREGGGGAVRAMDLGCGMGLAGVAAARLGLEVLFADIETAALLFARLNSLGDQGRCRARKVNWQKDRLGERFDLILGADIVYDRSQWQFLDPFFRAHLAPGGCILLGEPGRLSGEEFMGWITSGGWKLERRAQKLPGREEPIRLLELTLGT